MHSAFTFEVSHLNAGKSEVLHKENFKLKFTKDFAHNYQCCLMKFATLALFIVVNALQRSIKPQQNLITVIRVERFDNIFHHFIHSVEFTIILKSILQQQIEGFKFSTETVSVIL